MDSFMRDGLRFDVRDTPVAGAPGTAPAAVLLHGFPQDASAYDAVAPRLAAVGVRTLVPDQRGYSPGARPRGRRAYVVTELVADVLALLDAAGLERAHVVGHDWGGSVAWAFAARHPGRTASVTVLSTPHPAAMAAALRRGDQARRSSYMLWFQVPRLPELTMLRRDAAGLRRSLRRAGLEDGAADRYADRLLEPGALTSALAWYRAIPFSRGSGGGRIRVPTTYVTGRRDPFFSRDAVAATPRYVAAPFTHVELDADHWLPEHRPDDVAAAVLAHVR
ncbi:alpha/beta fold hydrolase [Actinotalea ferrariae]|uniref:alpha/beta fold hydrolase n=1 Tax=Actinotalea ferrariae TaxID=1386098 RepID=UPI001ED39E4F|nr:alpha/beta fold hydrolase [Actinotalea ferrariae]MBX9245944.1 alpha/beta fold hydrolase [Actinotalea ferrariae]